MPSLEALDIRPMVFDIPIQNAVTLEKSFFTALDLATGRITRAANTSGLVPMGVVFGLSTGSTSFTGNVSGSEKVRIACCCSYKYPVTGVTGIADIGKLVYVTDHTTLTLTKPAASSLPIGIIISYFTSTYAGIYLYHPSEHLKATQNTHRESLGQIFSSSLEGVAEQTLLSIPFPKHMTITSIRFQTVKHDAALIAGLQTIVGKIGTTSITGGSVSLACTNADALADIGTTVTATCTAANEIHAGETLNIVLQAGGTGFTAATNGVFNVSVEGYEKGGA